MLSGSANLKKSLFLPTAMEPLLRPNVFEPEPEFNNDELVVV